MAADISYSRVNFPRALRDFLKFLIRASKEKLLNARQRKTMGLQDANCLQLEQMPAPVAAPAGFRSVQQCHTPVIVKGSVSVATIPWRPGHKPGHPGLFRHKPR